MMKKRIFLLLGVMLLSHCALWSVKKNVKTTSPDPDTLLQQGIDAFFNYEFEDAEDYFSQYKNLQQKKKKPLADDFEDYERQLNIAGNAFDRVENIVILDSVALPKDSFFSDTRLSSSSGRLAKADDLQDNPGIPSETVVFINEDIDRYLWSMKDESGESLLYEASKLLNGEWQINPLSVSLSEDGADLINPFLSADGQTLYFSANGNESMGGFDLFVAQRDPISGEFLQPLNLGMPYNSPFDDLMIGIDEENGIGWWATDRFAMDDSVTVFFYLINDMRKNYPSDTDDLPKLAFVEEYKTTWPEDKIDDLNKIVESYSKKELDKKEVLKTMDFSLPMANGKVYTKFSDFRNQQAAEMMKQYLSVKSQLDTRRSTLHSLRVRYAKNKDNNIKENIIEIENQILELSAESKELLNRVYRLEKSKR